MGGEGWTRKTKAKIIDYVRSGVNLGVTESLTGRSEMDRDVKVFLGIIVFYVFLGMLAGWAIVWLRG